MNAAREAAVAGALALLLACRGSERHDAGAHADPAPQQVQAVPGMADVEVPYERRQLAGVRTAAVERRPLVREIRTVGLVAADERRVRRIQTKIAGWIEHLHVGFTGEAVEAGDPVLEIYSPELVASQREYLLALDAAGAKPADGGLGDREGELLVSSARSRLRLFDVSEAQIRELERTREVRRRVTLHSPIRGFVTLKSVLEGGYAMPETELYTVADLSRVWVWADVFEDEIALVELGQTARIEVSAAELSVEGAVGYLQPTLDAATRALRVRFELENAAGRLRPGMYATVTMRRPLGEVLALPEDAVIDTGKRRVVFVEIADGHFQPREVVLGRKGRDEYEVLSGLEPGERVVLGAQFLLDSESRLRGAGGPSHGAH